MAEDQKPAAVERAIGLRIKMLRSQKDMTQTDLAKLLGVKFQQVQKYENGTNRVSASRLKTIMEIFNVKWDYFFKDQAPFNATYNSGFADDIAPFEVPDADRPVAGADVSVGEGKIGTQTDKVFEILGTNEGIKLVSAFARIQDASNRKLVINLAESYTNSNK